MSDGSKPTPPEEWATIVADIPIVSVGLAIEHDGGAVLGKHENEPAKGEWFAPGRTVMKKDFE